MCMVGGFKMKIVVGGAGRHFPGLGEDSAVTLSPTPLDAITARWGQEGAQCFRAFPTKAAAVPLLL